MVELDSSTNGEVLSLLHVKGRVLSSHSDGTIKVKTKPELLLFHSLTLACKNYTWRICIQNASLTEAETNIVNLLGMGCWKEGTEIDSRSS